ncbi:DUF4276 family protein [Tunicatimonas pelagia]|uniref:DUF4276 family protein n=1 Tax=Tunicatimonas pelagia TaxID=931531 RepID=UPI002666F655|nr:DUF4276 family protein [Tunicatimonas pelagia]WKN40625.1 DUF4276 family protein [Tunicatimonas pelagia]
MKRLVFIVEGDTEIKLVDRLLVPHLVGLGFQNSMYAQTIITNRKQHKKGGVTSYGLFRNEVGRTLAQGNVIVTTMIDFFRLPTDFPSFTTDSTKIDQIEQAVHGDLDNHPDFIPYIQRHELEALMFSDRSGFELVIDDDGKMQQIDDILKQYPNPEDINNNPETAPSKRLQQIFNYDKTGDGELIFEMIGIGNIMDKCPRFATWIARIVSKLKETTPK